jgi:hypothetical protein
LFARRLTKKTAAAGAYETESGGEVVRDGQNSILIVPKRRAQAYGQDVRLRAGRGAVVEADRAIKAE